MFTGTLADVRSPLFTLGDRKLTYLFEVDTVVKGDVRERALMENFLQKGNSCNDELEAGERYLVFGEDLTELEHHACSRTTQIAGRYIEGADPRAGGPTLPAEPRRIIVVGAAVAAAGGA